MATYYFADNAAPYAHANAIQGNDAYNGLFPTFQGGSNGPKRNPANFNMDNLNAGDSVLCAIGGAWDNGFSAFVENPATSSMARTNMITFDQYDPGTGVTGKPRFVTSATGWLFNGYGGTGLPTKGGYRIRNLHIVGPGVVGDNFGITINPPLKWVIVEDCRIENFKAGINVRSETNCNSFYVYLHNNEITGCGLGAIVGTSNWLLCEKQNLHDNGEDHPLTHAIYAGAGIAESTAVTFRLNWLWRNNIDAGGVCRGGSLTCRGRLVGTHFDDNVIENTGGQFDTGAYGLSHLPGYGQVEYHLWTKMRRNTIRGFCSNLVFSSAPEIVVSDNIIQDTGLISQSAPVATLIGFPVVTLDPPDVTRDAGAQILRNTLSSTNPRTGTIGINVAGAAGNSGGADVRADGNTMTFGAGGTSVYAFSLSETLTDYESISNNTLSGSNGWHAGRTSLAAFQSYYAAMPGNVCTGNTGP